MATSLQQMQQELLEMTARVTALEQQAAENHILQNASTKQLVRQGNVLKAQIEQQIHQEGLNTLLDKLKASLNESVDTLIPLASGAYHPHNTGLPLFEVGHEVVHFSGHFIHYLSHATKIGAAITHSMPELLNMIPIVGGVIKGIDVYQEHQVIHQLLHDAWQQVGHLAKYSAIQRDALYGYVSARAVLSLDRQIVEQMDCQLLHRLLLSRTLFSLASSTEGEHEEDPPKTIMEFAEHWANLIIEHLKLQGGAMPENKAIIKTSKEVGSAYKVQAVFTPMRDKVPNTALVLPKWTSFHHEFHGKIFQDVLTPYDARAKRGSFLNCFPWYSANDVKNLRHYQSCFIGALKVIFEEFPTLALRDAPTGNYILQMALINTCLLANLGKMAAAMRWHTGASPIFINSGLFVTSNVPKPLEQITHAGIVTYRILDDRLANQERCEELSAENKGLKEENKGLKEENKGLEEENKGLKELTKSVQGEMRELRETVQAMQHSSIAPRTQQPAGVGASNVVTLFFPPATPAHIGRPANEPAASPKY